MSEFVFDISKEYEIAAKIPFDKLDLKLIHSLKPLGFKVSEIENFYPCVWEVPGKFVSGFETENRICVVFHDWAVSDLPKAIRLAKLFAGDSSGYLKNKARDING